MGAQPRRETFEILRKMLLVWMAHQTLIRVTRPIPDSRLYSRPGALAAAD